MQPKWPAAQLEARLKAGLSTVNPTSAALKQRKGEQSLLGDWIQQPKKSDNDHDHRLSCFWEWRRRGLDWSVLAGVDQTKSPINSAPETT